MVILVHITDFDLATLKQLVLAIPLNKLLWDRSEEDANCLANNNNNINNTMNSENIDVSRCPTSTGSKEEVTQSYAHKSVEADSTMQQPEQAKNINIEKTETTTESSLPLSTEVIIIQEVCLQSFTLDTVKLRVLTRVYNNNLNKQKILILKKLRLLQSQVCLYRRPR